MKTRPTFDGRRRGTQSVRCTNQPEVDKGGLWGVFGVLFLSSCGKVSLRLRYDMFCHFTKQRLLRSPRNTPNPPGTPRPTSPRHFPSGQHLRRRIKRHVQMKFKTPFAPNGRLAALASVEGDPLKPFTESRIPQNGEERVDKARVQSWLDEIDRSKQRASAVAYDRTPNGHGRPGGGSGPQALGGQQCSLTHQPTPS